MGLPQQGRYVVITDEGHPSRLPHEIQPLCKAQHPRGGWPADPDGPIIKPQSTGLCVALHGGPSRVWAHEGTTIALGEGRDRTVGRVESTPLSQSLLEMVSPFSPPGSR